MFKMLKYNCFPELLFFINPVLPSYDYSTRQIHKFRLPFPRTNCIRESFFYQTIDSWHGLEGPIKTLPTLKAFKAASINFYLNKY